MSQPAEVTSAQDWNQLVFNLGLFLTDVEALYERITGDEAAADPIEEEPMPDPDNYPDLIDDPDQQALDEQERERRLEAEIDGVPDGDYDREPEDYRDPDLEA
jgi:hypothetical protein